MDPRIIKNYDPQHHNITNEFLFETNDWDLVELNFNIDIKKIQEWYNTLENQYSHLKFGFNENLQKLNVETSKQMVEDGYCGYYCGPIEGITLAWTEEKYEPLPPSEQCNVDLFPEVDITKFRNETRILSKLRFGYFDYLINLLGEDAWKKAIVTIHHPGMYIRQHIDSKDLKLHIPIHSNENALFHFGKDRDRSYHMKVGKAYILNTADWHGTSNESDDRFKIHTISRIKQHAMQHVLSLTNENTNI